MSKNDEWKLALTPSGGVEVQIERDNGFNWTVTAGIAAGEWRHVAMTYDSSTVRIYVNGYLQHQTAFASSATASGQPLYIGSTDGHTSYYNGSIDEVRIYCKCGHGYPTGYLF